MIEHRIVYLCDECKAQAEERYRHPVDVHTALRYPCPPEGWQIVARRLLCAKHEVTVTTKAAEEAPCTS